MSAATEIYPADPASMSPARRSLEIVSQLIVIYSIVVFYLEAELTGASATRAAGGYWLWNERVILSIFALEYLVRWWYAVSRLRYPMTPLALVDMAAIASVAVGLTVDLRSLRLARLLPLVWMCKFYRYSRALESVLRGFRNVRHELAAVGFVALLALVFSAVAMHELERSAQPEKFGRLTNALWWAFVTMTTVGYGDIYPVTGLGRAAAAVTMVFGIGVLGTFISLLGSSYLGTMRDQHNPPAEAPAPGIDPDEAARSQVAWSRRKAG
jgi:voltage-gated potassium channel